MTVPTDTNRANYTGNGVTTAFAYTGKIFAETDLQVYVDGVLKTLTTDYTVDGVLSVDGGNVTFGTAPADTTDVLILRIVDETQTSSFRNQGAYDAGTVEDALDRRAEVDIQQQDEIDGAIKQPDYEARLDMHLPTVANRALKLMAFDTNGKPEALSLDTSAFANSAYDIIVENLVAASSLTGVTSPTTVLVKGRTTVGDGYQGTFFYVSGDQSASVTADPQHGMYIPVNGDSTGASGVLTRLPFNDFRLNAAWFGAVRDGVTDESTALNAMSAYGKQLASTPYSPRFFMPQGKYYVTKSLDFTTDVGNNQGFVLEGEGRFQTVILTNLSEAHPVIDCTGMWRANIRHLHIEIGATCLSQCGILLASNSASNSNYMPSIEDVAVVNSHSGLTNFVGCLVVFNADLARVSNCELNSMQGFAFSGGSTMTSGVDSKYQTIGSTPNQTDYRITDCWVTAPLPLKFPRGYGISIINSYLAVQGTLNADKCVILFNFPSQDYSAVFKAFNMRTENQASATELYTFYSKGATPMFAIEFDGCELNTDTGGVSPTGAHFKMDAGGNCRIQANFTCGLGTFDIFDVTGDLGIVKGSSNSEQFGAVSGTLDSFLWDQLYPISTDFTTSLPAGKVRGVASNKNIPVSSVTEYMNGVDDKNVTTVNGYNFPSWRTTASYTGGSGDGTVTTFKIPANSLNGVDFPNAVTRSFELDTYGNAGGTTTIKIQVRQGAHTYVLGTSSSATGKVYTKTAITCFNGLGGGTGIYVAGHLIRETVVEFTNFLTASYGTLDTTADMYIDFIVNSAANDPYQPGIYTAKFT